MSHFARCVTQWPLFILGMVMIVFGAFAFVRSAGRIAPVFLCCLLEPCLRTLRAVSDRTARTEC